MQTVEAIQTAKSGEATQSSEHYKVITIHYAVYSKCAKI